MTTRESASNIIISIMITATIALIASITYFVGTGIS